MVENTLNKIINKKEQKLNGLKKIISIESLKEKIKKNNTFIIFIYCIFIFMFRDLPLLFL